MRDKDRANKNEMGIFVFGENYGAVGSRRLIGGSLRRLPAIVRDDAPYRRDLRKEVQVAGPLAGHLGE